ncbi:MAG: class I SAM-dependent methyltransferase [Deltaproteobacteria bacterium]|nr:class I SAM-dependent methyltransferase [Deltaproteobacteria bacterium]
MEADRIKWNKRFASEDSFLGTRPSPFLSREIDRIKLLAPGARALDIACGEGRNSVFLAQNGFQVTGLDISDVGLSKGVKRAEAAGVQVDFKQVNLDGYCLAETYDLILNFNFLLRSLIPAELQALAPGGLLLFDTILESPQLLASHNPDYFLRKGELVRIFEAYPGDILFAEESFSGDMPTARVLFRKSTE